MPVPPSIFAVDEARLRYAQFDRSGVGFELSDYHDVGLDRDLFASGPLGGPIHDPERLRSALADLQSKLDNRLTQGSLILPDPWLRVALVDDEDLPRKGEAREEVLRWKLQRMVPYRVEELRVRASEIGLGSGVAAGRVLLGFGLEGLLRQLETVFRDRGIHLGYISSESMALISAVRDLVADVQMGAMAFVSARGYSLTFVFRGLPILHRFKALPQLAGDEPPQQLVDRDLRLTKMYLAEQFPGAQIDRLLLLAPPAIEARWLEWLTAGLGQQALAVRLENLPLAAGQRSLPLFELATLLGAARQEIR